MVDCVKAQDLPSRVARLEWVVRLPQGIAEAAVGLVQRAEAPCTIANTLLAVAEITTRNPDPAGLV